MFDTFDDMHAANRDAGQFWFEPDTLAFFNSQMHAPIHPTDRGDFFVTSEQAPESGVRGRADYYQPPRMYSVRFIDPFGHVHTVGGFQDYDELTDAHTAASILVRSDMVPTCDVCTRKD